jgi:hypothetical protein
LALAELAVLLLLLEGVDDVQRLVVLIPTDQHAKVASAKLVAGMALQHFRGGSPDLKERME